MYWSLEQFAIPMTIDALVRLVIAYEMYDRDTQNSSRWYPMLCWVETAALLFQWHYSDITWESKYLKSPLTRRCVQQLFQADNKEVVQAMVCHLLAPPDYRTRNL